MRIYSGLIIPFFLTSSKANEAKDDSKSTTELAQLTPAHSDHSKQSHINHSNSDIRATPQRNHIGRQLSRELGTTLGGLSGGVAGALLGTALRPLFRGDDNSLTWATGGFLVGAYLGGKTYGDIGDGVGALFDTFSKNSDSQP